MSLYELKIKNEEDEFESIQLPEGFEDTYNLGYGKAERLKKVLENLFLNTVEIKIVKQIEE